MSGSMIGESKEKHHKYEVEWKKKQLKITWKTINGTVQPFGSIVHLFQSYFNFLQWFDDLSTSIHISNEFQQIGTKRKRKIKRRDELNDPVLNSIDYSIKETIQRMTMVRFSLLVHYKQWATPFVFRYGDEINNIFIR